MQTLRECQWKIIIPTRANSVSSSSCIQSNITMFHFFKQSCDIFPKSHGLKRLRFLHQKASRNGQLKLFTSSLPGSSDDINRDSSWQRVTLRGSTSSCSFSLSHLHGAQILIGPLQDAGADEISCILRAEGPFAASNRANPYHPGAKSFKCVHCCMQATL